MVLVADVRGIIGSRVMPHFGQLPGLSETTSGCIGQVNLVSLPEAFMALPIAPAYSRLDGCRRPNQRSSSSTPIRLLIRRSRSRSHAPERSNHPKGEHINPKENDPVAD